MAERPAGGDRQGPFAFAQLEYGWVLGPGEGRYLVRGAAGAPPERIVVVSTLEVERERALGRARRGRAREVRVAEPGALPLTRVTVIDAEAFADPTAARSWLEGLERDRDALAARVAAAVVQLNRMLRAHRATSADPYVREVADAHALVRRVGYGDGVALADGRFEAALELPRPPPRRPRRRQRRSPHERLAAVLGGRAAVLACEELVLRARLDLDAERFREAALQARIALEATLAELEVDEALEPALAGVREARSEVAVAANTALRGPLEEAERRAVAAAVERMEALLARYCAR